MHIFLILLLLMGLTGTPVWANPGQTLTQALADLRTRFAAKLNQGDYITQQAKTTAGNDGRLFTSIGFGAMNDHKTHFFSSYKYVFASDRKTGKVLSEAFVWSGHEDMDLCGAVPWIISSAAGSILSQAVADDFQHAHVLVLSKVDSEFGKNWRGKRFDYTCFFESNVILIEPVGTLQPPREIR